RAVAWAHLGRDAPARAADGAAAHRWNERYLAALDQAVAQLTGQGLAVVLVPLQFHWSPAFKQVPSVGGGTLCRGQGMPPWLVADAGPHREGQALCDFFADAAVPGLAEAPHGG